MSDGGGVKRLGAFLTSRMPMFPCTYNDTKKKCGEPKKNPKALGDEARGEHTVEPLSVVKGSQGKGVGWWRI